MSKFKNSIEITTNLAIIGVCILIGVIVFQKATAPPKTAQLPTKRPQITKGEKLNLTDVDFSKSEKTLVLALSETCRFCTESASFYKKIAEETNDKDLQLIAAFPQSTDVSKNYLKELKVPINAVKQINLDDINVSGTPTLILLDKQGKVLNFWLGKLPTEKEEKVLATLKS